MSYQEILNEIQRLPPDERRRILESLKRDLDPQQGSNESVIEDEVERILLTKGIISRIPQRVPDTEEDEFEPIEVKGEPLSETIIRERR